MIFWIMFLILAVGIYLSVRFNDNHHMGLEFTGFIMTVLSCCVILGMSIGIIYQYCNANAQVAKNQIRYDALIYKCESEACRDEFGLLNKEIIDEIQDWNEDLAYYKNAQRDFWIGIFIPNKFDNFEYIDYKGFSLG